MSVEYTVPAQDAIPANTELSKPEVLMQHVKNHYPAQDGVSAIFAPFGTSLSLWFHHGALWLATTNSRLCSQEEALVLEPDTLYALVTKRA